MFIRGGGTAMRETDAILQAILYHHEKAKSVRECINAVKVMCNKENLDAVKARLAEEAEEEKAAGN
jgi:hypothetical protein